MAFGFFTRPLDIFDAPVPGQLLKALASVVKVIVNLFVRDARIHAHHRHAILEQAVVDHAQLRQIDREPSAVVQPEQEMRDVAALAGIAAGNPRTGVAARSPHAIR